MSRKQLEALEPFIGEWRMEATFPQAAPASIAGRALIGRAVFDWVLDGQFVALHEEFPHPDIPTSLAIIGVDPQGRRYTQHYFDSRGVTRVYAMTLRDGVWTLLRETSDFTPLDFAQRFTGTFSDDGTTITGRWESRSAGSTSWEHDFELTYTATSSDASKSGRLAGG